MSPLTRAIETFLGSCPAVAERLRAAAGAPAAGESPGSGGGGASQRQPQHHQQQQLQQQQQQPGAAAAAAPPPPNVVVLPLIAEHCATSGDVGRPASDLARAFPGLAPALAGLDEVWWYNPDPGGRPNCSRCGGAAFAETGRGA